MKLRNLNKNHTVQFLSNTHKEDLFVYIEFILGYIIHHTMFDVFKQDSSKVTNPRFILNCYHIILYERRGLLISDYYIQTQLERIFSLSGFTYLNQKALIQKKLRMSLKHSVFDGKFIGENQEEFGASSKNVFQNFNSIKDLLKKINSMDTKKVYEETRANIIDYYEERATKIATKEEKLIPKNRFTGVFKEDPSPKRKDFTNTSGANGFHQHSRSQPNLMKECLDLGFSKNQSHMFRLPFSCSKLSPAMEADLTKSFKTNLKPSSKKIVQLSLVEDSTLIDQKISKYIEMNSLDKSSIRLPKLSRSQVHNKEQNFEAVMFEQRMNEFVKAKGVKRDFIRGYGELLEMNDIMSKQGILDLGK